MADQFHVCELFASPSLIIRDVRCRPTDNGCGLPEESDDDAIVLVRRGAFVRRQSRKETLADTQRVLFFKRGESYRVYHPVEGGDDCTSLRFAPEILDEALGRSTWRCSGESGFTSTSYVCLQRLRSQAKAGVADALRVEETAMKFLAELAKARPVERPAALSSRADTRRAHDTLVWETRMLLARRFREQLSLGSIARQVHSSPFHLARIFSGAMGCPIHRYRLRLRLRDGLERLLENPHDLTIVALDLGFSSHSHFSDAFRSEFGQSPSVVRSWFAGSAMDKISKILKA